LVRAFRSQTIGQRKVAIEVPDIQRTRNGGELMDDHVRLRPCDRLGG
jgi:hypothetical protein